jgi:histidine triad (HIT) family protein
MSDAKCLFCRIISGEIPAQIIFQNESCVAFRDINPQAPVHVLVIPRIHFASLSEATPEQEELLGHVLRVCAKIAKDEGLREDGFRTVINTGVGAGQSVFHLHVHLLGGRPLNWPPG